VPLTWALLPKWPFQAVLNNIVAAAAAALDPLWVHSSLNPQRNFIKRSSFYAVMEIPSKPGFHNVSIIIDSFNSLITQLYTFGHFVYCILNETTTAIYIEPHNLYESIYNTNNTIEIS